MSINSASLVNNYNPAVSKVYNDGVNSVPAVFDKVFDVQTSKQQYEKMGNMTGSGLLMKKTEGMDAVELKVYQKYLKTFTHSTYAGFIRITKEAADDDLSGNIKKLAQMLGISTSQTIEVVAANYFDLAQTTAGPDGVALISGSHPLVGIGTSTGSNALSSNAALSVTSLEALLTKMRQTVDDYGNPKPLFPKSLLIPGMNEFTSIQLLKNTEKSGTTNRDINAIRERGLQSIIWDYLTLTGSWYLLTDPSERELIFFFREKINGQMKAAPDTTDDAIFTSRCRFSLGHIDWRGIAGSYGS